MMENYVFFFRGTSPFSNFYSCNINYDGMNFKSSEQLFMYLKAEFFGDHEQMENIMNAKTPQEAKRYGRLVKPYDDKKWSEIREEMMYKAVSLKFNQNNRLKSILKNQKGKTLVEASPYDKIWGIGIGEDNSELLNTSKWGLNLLGKVLMKVCASL